MAHSVEEQSQYMKIINFKPLSKSELTSLSSSIPSPFSFITYLLSTSVPCSSNPCLFLLLITHNKH